MLTRLAKVTEFLDAGVAHPVDERVSSLRDLGPHAVDHGDLGLEVVSCGPVGHRSAVDRDHKRVVPRALHDLTGVEPEAVEVVCERMEAGVDARALGLGEALQLPVADPRTGELL